MPSNLMRALGEGTLALLLGLCVLVLIPFFVPFSTNWRPPLTPQEMSSPLGMSEQELRAYGEQRRRELLEQGNDYRIMLPALLRVHFFALASVFVLWLGWRRSFGSGNEVIAFFLPLLIAMLAVSEYLTPIHWIFVLALAVAAWLRCIRGRRKASTLGVQPGD